MNNQKDCYCHTCQKGFHHLGIARHRSTHRDKGENCEITYSTGDTYTYNYSPFKKLIKKRERENGTFY